MKLSLTLVLTLAVGWLIRVTAADSLPVTTNIQTTVILVVGASGEPAYAEQFSQWATNWQRACAQGGARCCSIGLDPAQERSDKDRLQELLEKELPASTGELWLVLIGHGSFDGQEAKVNLRGPDLSAAELAAWLKPCHRPLTIVDCTASSAPFIPLLSGPDRVILTSTSSGYEQNYARFGRFLSESINDPQADLDKDGQTSLLEAFLIAANRVAEFYRVEGRLATEHPLLDDNGDQHGTPADWFRGLRAVKKPVENASLDGLRAHQFHLVRSAVEQQLIPAERARRDELERAILSLRDQKGQMAEDDYYRQLEKLLLDLAPFHQ